jgi:ABC-type dipeptide/oligopeptide/nickel transport system permease component
MTGLRPVPRLLAVAALTIVGASVVAFGFMHLAPMDPARFMIGFRQGVREDQISRLREWYGMDDPIPVQYVRWVSRVVRGDFGISIITRREVGSEVIRRIPWSLLLGAVGGLVALGLAVPLAVGAARGGVVGYLSGGLIALGAVVPAFLMATALVYLFAVRLTLIPILPPFDLNPFSAELWLGMILPTASVAIPLGAHLAWRLREDLTSVFGMGYVMAARARGTPERRIVWRHAAGVVTRWLLARPLPAISLLFSVVLLVEEIYNWPGVGRSFTRALQQRDIPVMQAVLLLLAVMTVGVEVLVRLGTGRLGDARGAPAVRPLPPERASPLPMPDVRMKAAVGVTVLLVAATIAAPVIARFPPDQVMLEEINLGPSLRHLMGTDSSGRDMLSRLLHAGRTTLGMALGGAGAAVAAGLLLTSGVAWLARWRAAVAGLSRVALAIPALALALAVVATAGRAPVTIAALFAGLSLGAVLGPLRSLQARAWRWPFVQAAQAFGAPALWIGERHLLPHAWRPMIAIGAGLVPSLVLLEATLGFLGFSVSPTTPTWGTLLWRAREAMHRGDWWLIVFPAGFLAAAAWSFGVVADALGRTAPPTYVRAVRLRLGREWGHVAATRPSIPARAPAGPAGTIGPPIASPERRLPLPGVARAESIAGAVGGETSGGSSD